MIANYIRFNYGLRWTKETQNVVDCAVYGTELVIGLLLLLKLSMWAMIN